MLGALGSLGFVVVAQGWALRGYLASGLPGRVPRVATLEEIGLAFGITLGVALLTGVPAMKAAEQRVRIGERS
jgi:hypothetical protein